MLELKVKQLQFSTSQKAWEGINEMFINADRRIFDENNGSSIAAGSLFAYNMVISIKKAWMEPNFNFGKMFDYQMQKWTLLLNNYINLNTLDILRSQVRVAEVKYTKNYNLSFSFDNTHTNGKGCLLSASFCRRNDLDVPIIIANMRSSEITKRLAFDLLLLQRLGEYVYGENVTFMLQLNCNQMYCNVETVIMYHTYKSVRKVARGFEAHSDASVKWNKTVKDMLKKFLTCDKSEIKYKVFVRTLRCLRPSLFPNKEIKPLYAKSLLLQYDSIPYPETCISYSQRATFKKKYLQQQKKEK